MTNTARILIGDCIEQMATLPEKSVHTCVTSPPYFGLRDYGVDGQIGLEDTPEEFVAKLTEVFRAVWRVLRDDGTLWLNLGDSYIGGGRGGGGSFGKERPGWRDTPPGTGETRGIAKSIGLKPKDLVGIPWRVALALQADGWYLRQDIIWHKPNPMPESVTDRCTKSHEYIFLLTKDPRYYYDAYAVREKSEGRELFGNWKDGNPCGDRQDNDRQDMTPTTTRNRRSVWTVATRPFKEAHFATFPPKLIEPCILAGCPEGGTVLDPFGGAGTTGLVAVQHERDAILCELNPEYAEIARKRIERELREQRIQPTFF